MLKITVSGLISKWIACRVTSSRKSVLYGIHFSYPIYVSLVAFGIYLVNPYILTVTALIAFFGVVLPMHPFDYVYNWGVARLIGIGKIPGRGSELQVNSCVALLFNLGVVALIIYKIPLNFGVMALIYVLSSMFFIFVHLFAVDSSRK